MRPPGCWCGSLAASFGVVSAPLDALYLIAANAYSIRAASSFRLKKCDGPRQRYPAQNSGPHLDAGLFQPGFQQIAGAFGFLAFWLFGPGGHDRFCVKALRMWSEITSPICTGGFGRTASLQDACLASCTARLAPGRASQLLGAKRGVIPDHILRPCLAVTSADVPRRCRHRGSRS